MLNFGHTHFRRPAEEEEGAVFTVDSGLMGMKSSEHASSSVGEQPETGPHSRPVTEVGWTGLKVYFLNRYLVIEIPLG